MAQNFEVRKRFTTEPLTRVDSFLTGTVDRLSKSVFSTQGGQGNSGDGGGSTTPTLDEVLQEGNSSSLGIQVSSVEALQLANLGFGGAIKLQTTSSGISVYGSTEIDGNATVNGNIAIGDSSSDRYVLERDSNDDFVLRSSSGAILFTVDSLGNFKAMGDVSAFNTDSSVTPSIPTLDEVLESGNISARDITVGNANINGNADINGNAYITGGLDVDGISDLAYLTVGTTTETRTIVNSSATTGITFGTVGSSTGVGLRRLNSFDIQLYCARGAGASLTLKNAETNGYRAYFDTALQVGSIPNLATQTYIVGGDGLGRLQSITVGSGLSLSGGVLTATGAGSGTIGGSGTSGIIPVFTGSSSIGNSGLSYDTSNQYLTVPSWIKLGSGGTGIFSDTGSSFFPNQTSSYGGWRVFGYRNGYSGFYFNVTNTSYPHVMFDAAGQGGFYNQGWGWGLYDTSSYTAIRGSSQVAGAGISLNSSVATNSFYTDSVVGQSSRGTGYHPLYVLQSTYWYDHTGTGIMYAGEVGNTVYARGTMQANIYTNDSNGNLFFGDSNYWVMRTTNSGAFGVAFEDSGGTKRGYIYGSGTDFGLLYGGGWRIRMEASQTVVIGNLVATGDVSAFSTSDIRLKEITSYRDSFGERLSKLDVINFSWKKEAEEKYNLKGDSMGLIAQQVKEVCPEAVRESDGRLQVDYSKLVPELVGAIKELQKEIEILKNG